MPRQLDQLPPDATSLARKVAALEREVRELRASRRAEYTALSEGGFKVYRPGSDIPAALMEADLGDGNAGFQTNSVDGSTYAQLESGQLVFGSPTVSQVLPTGITAKADGGTLDIMSGMISGGSQAHIIMASGDSPFAPGDGSPFISLMWDGAGSVDMQVDIGGILMPRSMAWGTVTITPSAANTPTSAVISGLFVRGNNFLGYASASSVVPGTQVTGVATSSVTSTGLTVWATRTNTTATIVNWLVIGTP